MAVNDGGYAFPRKLPSGEFPVSECGRIIEQHAGMTLLDYFAGQALPEVIKGDMSIETAMRLTGLSKDEFKAGSTAN